MNYLTNLRNRFTNKSVFGVKEKENIKYEKTNKKVIGNYKLKHAELTELVKIIVWEADDKAMRRSFPLSLFAFS